MRRIRLLTPLIFLLVGAALASARTIIVAPDGTGDFTTIQAAIMSVPEGYPERPVRIHIRPGEYREIIYIQREKRHFQLAGENPLTTRIVHGLHANMEGPEGGPLGTFRTATLTIDADDVVLENLTIENAAGPVGQALAVKADGDRLVFRNCHFDGWQDTLLLNRGRHYFNNCRIIGSTDFIFGGATALFDGCEIRSRSGSYVTAASTPAEEPFGFVFWGCRFTSVAAETQSYLGRPWRDHAAVAVLYSHLGPHIRPEGWHNWGRPEREKTARFREYQNIGPGAALDRRVAWSASLTDDGLGLFEKSAVLAGDDMWNPLAERSGPEIRFSAPAGVWTEALPIGNGRLGAMVHGGLNREHLQFNEDTLWEGTVRGYQHEGAYKVLPSLRTLLQEGRQQEAEALAMRAFMSQPLRQMPYQPFGDVYLEFDDHNGAQAYERWLDLGNAVSNVTYRSGGITFSREAFSSHPAGVLVQRVSANTGGAVNFRVILESPHEASSVSIVGEDELVLRGRLSTPGGLRFCARVRVVAEGGRVAAGPGRLEVIGADAATVYISAGTNFINYKDITGSPEDVTKAQLDGACRRPYADLKEEHIADHRALFGRVRIDLGSSDETLGAKPTVNRLERPSKGDDPDLAELMFHYGRYLLIASSRPGTQAANLQGIWNPHLKPPWESKYTLNINAQMNYWPAEVAALEECTEPFFRMIEDLSETGRDTARAHYAADGWVVHHNTDLWRGTAPINHSNHGIWPVGSAWLCLHLWEHWRFGGDDAFLRQTAYPIMKSACEFYLDYLIEDPATGWLISGPSNSPEHGGLVLGPTMDHQLIRGLFRWTAEAAEQLGVDAPFAKTLAEQADRLAPNRIGRHGQLQEWLEDVDDPENTHRHVSHLWGVFPGEDVTWATPELMRAATRSLELRGDGGTGWALGWKISLWARFLDGDRAHRLLMNQLNLVREDAEGKKSRGGGTYPNLFDAHPPFQIDGNFAATAGICEMLVQSHAGGIDLLPALPAAWPGGYVSGLRLRGGLVMDLTWRSGKLETVSLTARRAIRTEVRHGGNRANVDLTPGQTIRFGPELRIHNPLQEDSL